MPEYAFTPVLWPDFTAADFGESCCPLGRGNAGSAPSPNDITHRVGIGRALERSQAAGGLGIGSQRPRHTRHLGRWPVVCMLYRARGRDHGVGTGLYAGQSRAAAFGDSRWRRLFGCGAPARWLGTAVSDASGHLGANEVARERLAFAIFTVLIVLAGYGLIHLRHDIGTIWLVWLVLIVVGTDVFGYFAGRLIGGPKFWPRISPKKTWAGTVAGWIGAAVIGLAYVKLAGAGPQFIGVSIATSMAAQMGDIAESALKRHVGVKDSSNLIPGHGGFFDRFDGVLGAAIFLLLIERVSGFPPLA